MQVRSSIPAEIASRPSKAFAASRPTIRDSEYPDNEESVAGVRRSCTCFRFPYAPLRPLFDAARYVHCATPDVLPLTYSTPRGPPRASLMTVSLLSSCTRVSIRRRCTSRRTHHRAVGASGDTTSLNRLVYRVHAGYYSRVPFRSIARDVLAAAVTIITYARFGITEE